MNVIEEEAAWCRKQLKEMDGNNVQECDCWILHTDECERRKVKCLTEQNVGIISKG
jgi:hypothetical protein